MDINRNVLFEDLSTARTDDINRMNSFWGDDSWQKKLYREQDDLFGKTHQIKKLDYKSLALAYKERLTTIAGFTFVPEPVLMKNTNNGPLYYLFFASLQPVANKIINDIFRKHRQDYVK